jgi:hypothetical protein
MQVPEMRNPLTTINLAEEVERGFDELGKLPSRLERYAVAKQHALRNLAEIDKNINQYPVIDVRSEYLKSIKSRLSVCGNYLAFRDYYTVGQVRLSAARFCMTHLLCPLCAIRRGSKMVEAYVKKYEVIKAENPGLKMSMITFTVLNGENLAERHNHLKKSLQVLMKRSRDFPRGKGAYTEFTKVLGFVGSYEVTNKGQGWHPHAHLMVLHRTRINAAELKREWQKITGDSHVLRIDPARHPNDPGQDFLEVCKYALKFSDLTPAQNFHAFEVLRGKRLVMTAGLFWGVEIPEELTDEPLEGLPYFERLYNFAVDSGYHLTGISEYQECATSEHETDLQDAAAKPRFKPVNLFNSEVR